MHRGEISLLSEQGPCPKSTGQAWSGCLCVNNDPLQDLARFSLFEQDPCPRLTDQAWLGHFRVNDDLLRSGQVFDPRRDLSTPSPSERDPCPRLSTNHMVGTLLRQQCSQKGHAPLCLPGIWSGPRSTASGLLSMCQGCDMPTGQTI